AVRALDRRADRVLDYGDAHHGPRSLAMHVVTHFLRCSMGAAAAETQTSFAERAALARNAFARRTVVEIGVWHGVTTSLLKLSMDPACVLYAVDPFPRGRLGICL